MENSPKSRSVYYVYGNMGGNNLITETETTDVCAKEIIIDKDESNEVEEHSRCYVRHSPLGFFNPLNVDKRKHHFYIRHEMYRWIKVSRAGFDIYLQFLRTGKKQFLHQAERLF